MCVCVCVCVTEDCVFYNLDFVWTLPTRLNLINPHRFMTNHGTFGGDGEGAGEVKAKECD